MQAFKKSLLSEVNSESKAIDKIAKEDEAIRKRVDILTDQKMYTLIQLYEAVKTCKKELDEAIAYYNKPFGLWSGNRLASDVSCLESIERKADALNTALKAVQSNPHQISDLKKEASDEQTALGKVSMAHSELVRVSSQAITNREFTLTKTEEEARKVIDEVSVSDIGNYCEVYRKKLNIENPGYAKHLAGLSANLADNISKTFPKKSGLDAKKH